MRALGQLFELLVRGESGHLLQAHKFRKKVQSGRYLSCFETFTHKCEAALGAGVQGSDCKLGFANQSLRLGHLPAAMR
jgi:hypothetical protein